MVLAAGYLLEQNFLRHLSLPSKYSIGHFFRIQNNCPFRSKCVVTASKAKLSIDAVTKGVNVPFYGQQHRVLVSSAHTDNFVFFKGQLYQLRNTGVIYFAVSELTKVCSAPWKQVLFWTFLANSEGMETASLDEGDSSKSFAVFLEKLNDPGLRVSILGLIPKLPSILTGRQRIKRTPRPNCSRFVFEREGVEVAAGHLSYYPFIKRHYQVSIFRCLKVIIVKGLLNCSFDSFVVLLVQSAVSFAKSIRSTASPL